MVRSGHGFMVALEDAFVVHWSHFGSWSGGSLHEQDGVLWYETSIPQLPYNMVMRTNIPDATDADSVIGHVTDGFRARDVPYLWVIRPSDRPDDLGQRLARQGLDLVETIKGMDIELDDWKPEHAACGVRIEVADYQPDRLRDYIEMARTYWSVPESSRHLLTTFNEEFSGDNSPGVRTIAYLDDEPVGKLFLNTVEMPDRVAIYGVATKPEARGRGVATALMEDALERAVALGARRCVLHSSDMAYRLYRRMGFVERCKFYVYATGPIFGTHHH